MTCSFCRYEFCWSCRASASAEDKHFELMRGCGVPLIDDSVKPGDHLKINRHKQRCTRLLKILVMVILSPLLLVFYLPYTFMIASWKKSQDTNVVLRGLSLLFYFVLGMLADIIFIPPVVVFLLMLLIKYISIAIFYILTCYCLWKKFHRTSNLNTAITNEERARRRISEILKTPNVQ